MHIFLGRIVEMPISGGFVSTVLLKWEEDEECD
jgi:hypothetical protein